MPHLTSFDFRAPPAAYCSLPMRDDRGESGHWSVHPEFVLSQNPAIPRTFREYEWIQQNFNQSLDHTFSEDPRNLELMNQMQSRFAAGTQRQLMSPANSAYSLDEDEIHPGCYPTANPVPCEVDFERGGAPLTPCSSNNSAHYPQLTSGAMHDMTNWHSASEPNPYNNVVSPLDVVNQHPEEAAMSTEPSEVMMTEGEADAEGEPDTDEEPDGHKIEEEESQENSEDGEGEEEEESEERMVSDDIDSDQDYKPGSRRRAGATTRRKGPRRASGTSRQYRVGKSGAATTTRLRVGRTSSNTTETERSSSGQRQARLRPFTCPLSPYGCRSTFATKNEWKRHVNIQHLALGVYRCDRCPEPQGRPNDFNRKDLFTQHLRRMHFKEREPSAAALDEIHRGCWLQRRRAPTQFFCVFEDQAYVGKGTSDDWLEHVARHLTSQQQSTTEEMWAKDSVFRDWLVAERLLRTGHRAGSWVMNGAHEDEDAEGDAE